MGLARCSRSRDAAAVAQVELTRRIYAIIYASAKWFLRQNEAARWKFRLDEKKVRVRCVERVKVEGNPTCGRMNWRFCWFFLSLARSLLHCKIERFDFITNSIVFKLKIELLLKNCAFHWVSRADKNTQHTKDFYNDLAKIIWISIELCTFLVFDFH